MNFMPTFKFRFRDNFFSALTMAGVLLGVVALIVLVATSKSNGADRVTLTAISFFAAICFLIIGLVSIRDDLRMGGQFGVSRPTVFAANVAAAVAGAVVLAVLGEVVTIVGQAAAAAFPNLFFSDFYQMLFLKTTGPMSLSQHAASAFFNFTLQMLSYAGGVVLSLLFFRLSKRWSVIAGIGLGVALLWGFPYVAWRFASVVAPAVRWLLSTLGNWTLAVLPATAVLLFLGWLLLRRAPVKSAK